MRKFKQLKCGLILGALLMGGLTGCKSFAVESQYSAGTNYAEYKTFAFSNTAASPPQGFESGHLFNSIMQRRVRDEVTQVLRARGYDLVPASEASFLIRITGGQNQSVQSTATGGPVASGVVEGGAVVVETGALVLHFVDPTKKKFIWRGWAEAVMSPSDDMDKAVREAVRKILAVYPPKGA